MTTLHIKAGPLAGETIEVSGDLTIGRQNSDITIADVDLSRRHAIIRQVADGLEIEDLGSKNGTFVDGRRIDHPTVIRSGARLELGNTIVEVDVPALAQAAAPELTVDDAGAATASRAVAPKAASVAPAEPSASPEPAAASALSSPQPVAAALPPLAAPSRTPIGVFHPPSRRRGRLATRSLVPVLLSFGSAVLTAVALVIYFALR